MADTRKMCDIRFEKGEAKRRAVIEFLLQGCTVKEALERVGMSDSMHQKNRSKYPEYKAQVERAKLVSRDLQSGLLTSKHHPRRDDPDHVPSGFAEFVAKFFAADRDAPMVHQLMLADQLRELRPLEVVLFLLWPGSGKSATVEDYICRKLALDPKHRFRVVSQTRVHAVKLVNTVKNRMTDIEQFPEFIAKFGPFYEPNQERHGKAWASDMLKVWKNPGTDRDYNVFASSWSAATLGARIDTLIFDDIQSPENYNQAEEIFNRVTGTFFSREAEIRTIIIGNRVGPGDVYERMMDAGLISRQVIVPAAGSLGAEEGMPSVPQWWDRPLYHEKGGPCCGGIIPFRECPENKAKLTPVEYMELTKHRAQQNWWSLYMQHPQAAGVTTFGETVDQCLDRTRTYGPLINA